MSTIILMTFKRKCYSILLLKISILGSKKKDNTYDDAIVQ